MISLDVFLITDIAAVMHPAEEAGAPAALAPTKKRREEVTEAAGRRSSALQ
jgi:hypothetical protein